MKSKKETLTLNTIRKLSLYVLVISIISCQDSKEVQDKSTDILDPIDKFIAALVEKDELVGAEIVVIKNEETVFHKVYGWKDVNKERAIHKNDIWLVKSMTKPVTATAILILRDEGKLSLDDPLIKYIPEFMGNKQITIRNLLLHNSGDDGSYEDNGYNVYYFDSQEEWVMDWAKEKSKGEFGTYAYSNWNYEALGFIVSKVSGKSVAEFISEKIFKPLEMNNTYTYFSPKFEWSKRVPNRYKNNSENEIELIQTNNDRQPWKFFPASFGLWMTAEDYATFLQMWMNGGKHKNLQVIQENSVEEALQIGVWINEEDQVGQGFGWMVDTKPFIYYKGGADGSVGIAFPEEKMIIVFTTHLQKGPTNKVIEFLGKLLFGWD